MAHKSVKQSRTTDNDSERAAYQVKIQENVETTWLFNTGADAHVMPKYVWEQFRAPALQTTRVTLRGANGQDLGAVGELHVRSFIGKIKVQFTVVARDARRYLLSGTQLRTKVTRVTTLNQHEVPHTTNKRRKSNDVTRRKQRHSQSCVHVEAKSETRVGKCETRIAKPQDRSA